ncbi:uncharacterized protein LOC123321862 [Coccinella septempunctata]|uniref:uncharacterized protein LOC123321862 n=1 Tax=Coccinella septempunctata TaxID=41139 RepID=UPI001D08469E|nr:uncharacterized protein LOC123321862 [Coccinella septempunctata]
MKCIQRGEDSLSSGHLETCNFDPGLRIIKAKVKSSMKNKSYDVEVFFKFNYEIDHCSCSCPRGQFMCHHIACVLIHAHYNISTTDVPCMWVPRANEVEDPCQITTDELFDPLGGSVPHPTQIQSFQDNL